MPNQQLSVLFIFVFSESNILATSSDNSTKTGCSEFKSKLNWKFINQILTQMQSLQWLCFSLILFCFYLLNLKRLYTCWFVTKNVRTFCRYSSWGSLSGIIFVIERKPNWESGNWISSFLWCVEPKEAVFSFLPLVLKRQLELEGEYCWD